MKTTAPRIETRHYSKADLLRRWLKRGERRPHEGEASGAILALTAPLQPTLAAIRESRERLDSLHGRVLDLAPRLRDLCWAIDAAEAQERDMTEVEARTPVAVAAPPVTQSPAPALASAAVPMTKRRLREWAASAA